MTEFHYKIYPRHSFIVTTFVGEIGMRDVTTALQEMWADPDYDPTFDGISDLSRAKVKGTPKDLAVFTQFMRNPQLSIGRWAVVVCDARGTALSLLFQTANVLQKRMGVFSTWEAACSFHKEAMPELFVRKHDLLPSHCVQ